MEGDIERQSGGSNTSKTMKGSSRKKPIKWSTYRKNIHPKNYRDPALSLKTDLLKMLNGIHADSSISTMAMDVLADTLVKLTRSVMTEANSLRLIDENPPQAVRARDVETAFKLIFDGQLLSILQARAKFLFELTQGNTKLEETTHGKAIPQKLY